MISGSSSVLVEARTPSSDASMPSPEIPPPPPLLHSKTQNSDSGISHCSAQSPDIEPSQPPVIAPPMKKKLSERLSQRLSQSASNSPRLDRPDHLSLQVGKGPKPGPEGEPGTSEGGGAAALVLRNPHTTTPSQPGSETIDGALPPHWEARMDRHGRIFFVDHLKKTTSWERPRIAEERRDGDGGLAVRGDGVRGDGRMATRRTVGSTSNAGSSSQNQSAIQIAQAFLQRPDFHTCLQRNPAALELYNSCSTLKHLVSRIRKEPNRLEKFLGHSQLLAFLNAFADTSQPLPSGWESKTDSSGLSLFVDHGRRETSLLDPRLPSAPPPRRRPRSAPASRPGDSYEARVIAFLRRGGLLPLLQARLPGLAADPKLRRKLAFIAKAGTPALERYANDLDLITVLSAFQAELGGEGDTRRKEEARPDSFDGRLRDFYGRLTARGYGQGPGKLRLELRREELVKDAFNQIGSAAKRDLQRSKLSVSFDGEEGLDYGGPSREFFFLLSRELFNPYYGLFEYSANDTYTVQISPMSQFVDDYPDWFAFCGRVLGLALIHRHLIDVFFTRPFYKRLLKDRAAWAVSDLESVDREFHASLRWLEESELGDGEELGLTFAVNEDVGGRVLEKELIPGGASIRVSQSNKSDYIAKMLRWRLERGLRRQANALLRGFYEVVDPALVGIFDARELELVLSGTVEIDLADWRANTEYRGGYSDSHVVVDWFWEAVDRFSNAQRLQLLQFVTGTSSIPHDGFAALRGSHGPKKFSLEKWGSVTALPRAHTCFNRLDLPAYPSASLLYTKLLLAIEESSTYGIE